MNHWMQGRWYPCILKHTQKNFIEQSMQYEYDMCKNVRRHKIERYLSENAEYEMNDTPVSSIFTWP